MQYHLPSEFEVLSRVQTQGLQQLIQQRTGTTSSSVTHDALEAAR
jgi:hypothetical protein